MRASIGGWRAYAMKKFDLRAQMSSLHDIYNLKDDYAKGRLISLGSALMTAF